jgi:hypothetical protein
MWKRDLEHAIAKGQWSAGVSPTLRDPAEQFLAGAQSGVVRSRNRER